VSRLGVEKWVLVDEFVALAHKVNENPIFSTIIRHNLQKLSKRQRLIEETFKEKLFSYNCEMSNNTTFVVIALVALLALLGVVVVTAVTLTQEVEARGCALTNGVAVNASQGRCLHP
jgi:hypothetical protein